MKINHKGFGAIEVFIIVVIAALLGLVGWLVWNRTQNAAPTSATTQSADNQPKSKTAQSSKKYEVPKGYTTYTNDEFGFSFSYPDEYGEMTKHAPENDVRIASSEEPTTAYGPGILGKFTLWTREPSSAAINSRKYGPQIKLQNGKWIVVEANEFDVVGNKVGDEYRDFSQKKIASQKNGSLDVYTLISGNEGVEMDSLVFTIKGKLHELDLPVFSDGSYGDGTQAQNPDKTAFDTLLKNVRDSIRIRE